jgi:hypothetical protein
MSLRRASLIAALGTSLFALLAFGTVHAVWIVPIWRRLIGGLPFTVAGALALAWAYAELSASGLLPRRSAVAGLVFGLGAWAALVPVTGLSILFRMTGIHRTYSNLTTTAEVLAAALTGLAIARGLRAGRRCAASLAVAAGVLLLVQAGPVAILNGRRPLGLFFLLAGIYALSGVLQAVFTDLLRGSARIPAAAA